MTLLSLSLLLACAQQPRDPCAQMCSAATRLYGGCLAAWNAEWSAAGYNSADDFFHRCETWAWEMRLLEDDARRQGEIDASGYVDATCTRRYSRLTSRDATCTDYTDIDWNQVLWPH